jgi:hypothetical protein
VGGRSSVLLSRRAVEGLGRTHDACEETARTYKSGQENRDQIFSHLPSVSPLRVQLLRDLLQASRRAAPASLFSHFSGLWGGWVCVAALGAVAIAQVLIPASDLIPAGQGAWLRAPSSCLRLRAPRRPLRDAALQRGVVGPVPDHAPQQAPTLGTFGVRKLSKGP